MYYIYHIYITGDDIIQRLRSVSLTDLETKAAKISARFTLAIEKPRPPTQHTAEQVIRPALYILARHSNMKPHLDNGMNQNGIYTTGITIDCSSPLIIPEAYVQLYPVAGSDVRVQKKHTNDMVDA